MSGTCLGPLETANAKPLHEHRLILWLAKRILQKGEPLGSRQAVFV